MLDNRAIYCQYQNLVCCMSDAKGQYLYYYIAQPINHHFSSSPNPTTECYCCTKCLETNKREVVRVTLFYPPENYIEI